MATPPPPARAPSGGQAPEEEPLPEPERVRFRLFRKGRLVARAAREVVDGRAVVRLEAAHRLAAGSYTLVVTAVHADGSASSERRRVTVR